MGNQQEAAPRQGPEDEPDAEEAAVASVFNEEQVMEGDTSKRKSGHHWDEVGAGATEAEQEPGAASKKAKSAAGKAETATEMVGKIMQLSKDQASVAEHTGSTNTDGKPEPASSSG